VVQPPPPPPPAAPVKPKPAVHKPRVHHREPKPLRPPAKPLLASAAPVAQKSGSLPALLIIAFGVLIAAAAVGFSFVPASAVPLSERIRLEESRQTILFVGLAIGVPCALVGLLMGP
jgi:hypothetical protein